MFISYTIWTYVELSISGKQGECVFFNYEDGALHPTKPSECTWIVPGTVDPAQA